MTVSINKNVYKYDIGMEYYNNKFCKTLIQKNIILNNYNTFLVRKKD